MYSMTTVMYYSKRELEKLGRKQRGEDMERGGGERERD